ncbi:CPBP family intramembrane glutamic endopeptidase [Pradoshia sp.]
MKKNYWLIILTYVAMQLSSIIGLPLMGWILPNFVAEDRVAVYSIVSWIVISFSIGLVITLFFLRNERQSRDRSMDLWERMPLGSSIAWAIGGIFLAFIAQAVAGTIEQQLFRVNGESQNTQNILNLIEMFPVVILITSVIGPILEEIVFRKILFGALLYKRLGFFLSALISSVIFSLAHGEPEHTLLYSAMGFTFAFLYVKTGRIIVPIIAHVSMNTLVILISTYSGDMIKEMEKAQSFIGGLL